LYVWGCEGSRDSDRDWERDFWLELGPSAVTVILEIHMKYYANVLVYDTINICGARRLICDGE
jgi:hypothetical protein